MIFMHVHFSIVLYYYAEFCTCVEGILALVLLSMIIEMSKMIAHPYIYTDTTYF